MCHPGTRVWPRDDGTLRETTREGAGVGCDGSVHWEECKM